MKKILIALLVFSSVLMRAQDIYVLKAGDTMTGPLVAPSLNALINATSYSTLADAVAACTNQNCTVQVNGAVTVSSNTTISAQLQINYPGKITVANGQTLTLSQAPVAGAYQIFAGNGTVSFSNQVAVRPEWWGATPYAAWDSGTHTYTNSLPALQAACAALPMQPNITKKTLTGMNPRQGTILFQPMYYVLFGGFTCTYGVKYQVDTSGATATLAVDSFHNVSAYPEKFILQIDPLVTNYPTDLSLNSNTAFNTVIDGISVTAPGTNFSGIFLPYAQGTRLNNVASSYTAKRGCLLITTPGPSSINDLRCDNVSFGSGLHIINGGTFSHLEASDINSTGKGATYTVSIPAGGTVTMPVTTAIDTLNRVQIIQGNGATFLKGEDAFPSRYMTSTVGTPITGQYAWTSGSTIQFASADAGTVVRIFYTDTGAITTDTAGEIPVPSVQFDLGTPNATFLYCEGSYLCLNTYRTNNFNITALEAHPNTSVSATANIAAVELDAESNGLTLGAIRLFDPTYTGSGGQKWQYSVRDFSNSYLKTAIYNLGWSTDSYTAVSSANTTLVTTPTVGAQAANKFYVDNKLSNHDTQYIADEVIAAGGCAVHVFTFAGITSSAALVLTPQGDIGPAGLYAYVKYDAPNQYAIEICNGSAASLSSYENTYTVKVI